LPTESMRRDRSGGWQLGSAGSILGAKWGAIIRRHEATWSLLQRSISLDYQVSDYSEPYRPTVEISFASRCQGLKWPGSVVRPPGTKQRGVISPARPWSGGYPAGRERVSFQQSLVAPDAKEGAGMLLDIRDTPADIGPGAPAIVAGVVRFARAVRTRWRVMFLLAGAVLTVVGVLLASGAVLIPGVLVLLFALLYGIGASGCISADQLAGWPWHG